MPTFVMLGTWTDKGIANVKNTLKREDEFRALCQKHEARVVNAYRTSGPYDVVALVEAPDVSAMRAINYTLRSQGNINTHVLRAFSREETEQVIAKMG
jgi:uncharacterized protein with GYD domain